MDEYSQRLLMERSPYCSPLDDEGSFICSLKTKAEVPRTKVYHERFLQGEPSYIDEDRSPEVLPLALGGFLFIAALIVSIIAVLVACQKRGKGDKDRLRDHTGSRFGSWIVMKRPDDKDEGHYEMQDPISEFVTKGSEDDKERAEDARRLENNSEVIMSWKDLSCSYPPKKAGGKEVTTLSEVTGEIRFNELVAIMGVSGGGKSTLMDILSGRKSLGNIGGDLSLLGEHLSNVREGGDLLRNVAAYVPQSEQFFPTQTPEEAVEFVANLKLGRDKRGDHFRRLRIRQVLDLFKIPEEARNRPIGGTLAGGLVIRGLSGGERKRLALACAVAMKPSLLFLDEITSGLDSENAVLVVDMLKNMCNNMNVAAVLVIHQPSYEVFCKFDRLFLLTKGKCVFADRISEISSWYDQLGQTMPDKYLIPGSILKIASEWGEKESELVKRSTYLSETSGESLRKEIEERVLPSIFLRFKTVLFRQLINHYVRNLTNLAARIFIYVLVSLIFGSVFWQIADTKDGEVPVSFETAQAVFGATTFMTQISYLLPFSQISTFFFDKKIFTSENPIGLYDPWMYSLSQFILEAWLMTLCALGQACVSIPMIALRNPSISGFSSFVSIFALLAFNGLVGNTLVLLISTLAISQDLAFVIGSGGVVIFLALSGGFVPYPLMQDWIVWLQWISPIKYSFQTFVLILFEGTSTAELLERNELDRPGTANANIGILFAIFMITALASSIAMARQREVR